MKVNAIDRYDIRNMYTHFIETSEEEYDLVSHNIVRYKSLLYRIKYSIEMLLKPYLMYVYITTGNGIQMS